MLVNPNNGLLFLDDKKAPTTIDRRQVWKGHVFDQTKNYFSIQIKPNVIAAGAPNPLRFFDIENYNANKLWYDRFVIVNGNRGYEYILNEVINNAFKLVWLKINWRFTDLKYPQVQEPFYKVFKDSDGNYLEELILSYEVFDLYQNLANVINIDMRSQWFLLDGLTYLQYRLVEDTGTQGFMFTFFYEKLEKSDVLNDASMADKLTSF